MSDKLSVCTVVSRFELDACLSSFCLRESSSAACSCCSESSAYVSNSSLFSPWLLLNADEDGDEKL
ncbi:hypothetical protein BpHYR1_044528 [Brachionus plicatilis]|uniref:Uncharacterized protein n=1 Tax=Brachionus plicatilis TaxID=10195 RepID=A0A3M7SZA4_BRAPC|nr:hypothetical protein BpHYR1_044528 [Brachionus plicatilis]